MSQARIELVRRWAQAFNDRDMDALLELTSPDFEFVPYLANLVETTTYRGHDGLRRYFEDADAAWEEIRVELDDVRVVTDRTARANPAPRRATASRCPPARGRARGRPGPSPAAPADP